MIVSDKWDDNVMILIIRFLLAQAFAKTRNLTQKKWTTSYLDETNRFLSTFFSNSYTVSLRHKKRKRKPQAISKSKEKF